MATNQAFGFASMNGGTSGGNGGREVTVSTGAQLQASINAAGSSPITIRVDGKITTGNTGADSIVLANKDNISIIGTGGGAEFDGIGIHVKDGSSNLIIQNLKIHDVKAGVGDAISIEGPSRNIWIDNNELYSSMSVSKDYYDGLLDIKRGAEYITVSNNHFHDHHKVSLVGYSDADTGARYVTYAHNLFENIGSRAPSIRDGFAHVYENHFKNVEVSGINIRAGGLALIENNVFENVRDPIASLDSGEVGRWQLRGNVFNNVRYSSPGANEAVAGTDNKSTGSYSVPYGYELVGAGKVAGYVGANAGPGGVSAAPAPQPVPDTGDTGGGQATNVGATGDADTLTGTSGNDTIKAAGGADLVRGGDGNDRLEGESNDDTLHGGNGNDTLLGGEGRDSLLGDGGDDELDGGNSADLLNGGDGRDLLRGGGGDDRLLGGAGQDTLEGGDGKDTLEGGSDADRLSGGAGSDVLTGGGGNDVFVFGSLGDSSGSNSDMITDFATGDLLDLSGIDANASRSGDQAFAFVGTRGFSGSAGELRYAAADGDTWIEGDVDGDRSADLVIRLDDAVSLAARDFVL